MAHKMQQPTSVFSRATNAAGLLRERLPQSLQRPIVAIVCGSGLANLHNALWDESKIEVSYHEVDGMPKPTVEGHEGKFVFGFLGGERRTKQIPVMLLVGRAHFYEGHSMELVTYATRLCSCLAVKVMIVTNASGGLNPAYNAGDLVILNDHLNLAGLAGLHPLRGPNENDFGVRFLPLSDAYDLDLRRRAHVAWASISSSTSQTLHEGVYAFVVGPSYETRAEGRMLRLLGADVVGMSTVPEVIVARHCGMRVLALSLVTNNVVLEAGPSGNDEALIGMNGIELEQYLNRGKANHEEVLEEGKRAAQAVQGLIAKIVATLDAE